MEFIIPQTAELFCNEISGKVLSISELNLNCYAVSNDRYRGAGEPKHIYLGNSGVTLIAAVPTQIQNGGCQTGCEWNLAMAPVV